ncbi:MAG: YajQ family cyclic di-GMP-binding protein [Deltaproteobacteria bacterium]|nr:YajQ family cyclic di-GMP-binding protein [Deltaproteobacteria bacterium]
MPSFDTVSKIDMQELDNGINQAKKEIGSRYDFQGAQATIELAPDKKTIQLKAINEGKLEATREVLYQKIAKRGVSLTHVETGKMEPGAGQSMKQTITLVQGIAIEKAKKLVAAVKDSKLKVQASIQGDSVRVTSKSRDELQECMKLLRSKQDEFQITLSFENFRD